MVGGPVYVHSGSDVGSASRNKTERGRRRWLTAMSACSQQALRGPTLSTACEDTPAGCASLRRRCELRCSLKLQAGK